MFEDMPRAPSLGSDNHSGVHPEIMQALVDANLGHTGAYGTDPISQAAYAAFARHFGDVRVHFVFNGTAANVLALRCMMPSYAAVLCARTAHVQLDECAAPEFIIGCKVLPLPSYHGKVLPEDVAAQCIRAGDQHFAAPRVLSVAQPTELGTLYSVQELRALRAVCTQHGLLLHMDGARLVNAAASLNVSLAALTAEVGVDVLSLGGTKNGLMFGEAVVFFNKDLARDFPFIRKQSMQLASKMRFVAAQFCAWLEGDLWQRSAVHANRMAQHLAQGISAIPNVHISHPVQANAVFVRLPRPWLKALRRQTFFYVWNDAPFEVRWMTTFDTQPDALDTFCAALQEQAAGSADG